MNILHIAFLLAGEIFYTIRMREAMEFVALDSTVRIESESCIVGNLIELRRAISHPNLAEPVAFMEGIEVSNLLGRVVRGSKAESVIRDWSACVGNDSAIWIFSWAWRNRLVLPLSTRLSQS